MSGRATTLTGWFALLGLLVFGTSGTPAVLGWSWSSTPLLRYPLRAACVTIGLGVLLAFFLVFIAAVGACFSLYRALIGLLRPFGAGCLTGGLCVPSGPFVVAGSCGGGFCLVGVFFLAWVLEDLLGFLACLPLALPIVVILFW